jgi:hypothetical protein
MTVATHPIRGRFNAGLFTALDGYNNWLTRERKRQAFADLPQTVVEVGPGVGANFRYLRPGTRLIAIEPNPHMHRRLQRRAARNGTELEIHGRAGGTRSLNMSPRPRAPACAGSRIRSGGRGLGFSRAAPASVTSLR